MSDSMASRSYSINFMGDTMLGRLIDQLLPIHVHEPEAARIVSSIRASAGPTSHLVGYNDSTIWGNTLSVLQSADLNFLNLETSVTTHAVKWPTKVFNYRMHPANISALQVAGIHYAGLANNHTLDFREEGLLETAKTVKAAGIAFAGAGENEDEATKPAILYFSGEESEIEHEIHVWAASDHPSDWAKVRTFHFIDYTPQIRARLKKLLTAPTSNDAALKVFSVHWGPNYSWQPADEIRDLAHFLVDECGIDIVHGHSSHHVQGVEVYAGKLIIYGCGDFVDDYAVVPGYRNDLSAVWRVSVENDVTRAQGRLVVKRLEIFPTIIEQFRVRLLEANEADSKWTRKKIIDLSTERGSEVQIQDDGKGRLLLEMPG